MTELKIVTRKAQEKDLPEIRDIYNDVIKEGGFTADLDFVSIVDRKRWFAEHRSEPYDIYVLEVDNNVIAYFYFSPWRKGRAALNKVAEISFFVHAGYRGKGLGNMILEHAIRIGREKEFTHLMAILLDINVRSRSLLEKWEFMIVGKLPEIVQFHDKVCGQLMMLRTL
jgi:L-amino acid N-acyltransferase